MLLKSTFLELKKSCTSCPNWGEGGGEVIWTKSKRTAAFFRENVSYFQSCRMLSLCYIKNNKIIMKGVKRESTFIGNWILSMTPLGNYLRG